MRKLKSLWRSAFDVREGEHLRTLFMSLYLLCILFAYYVQRPVADSLFLNKFDLDKLPWLYILIAAAGGVLAYLYTKVAVQASLQRAVTWAMALAVSCLVAFWWLVQFDIPWLIYAFNVWVKLFSIVMVTQGWVVASNVFTSREAKRLYALLGAGAVLGAAFGGTFTRFTVEQVGNRGLLLASACMVVLAYASFRATIALKGVSLAAARATEGEEHTFSFRDIVVALGRYRHLQVIVGIITVNYMVDVLLDFQFKGMAKAAFQGEQLTAFFGTFYGIYLNAVTITLQLFLTSAIVRGLGVGGTLLISPTAISAASAVGFLSPGLGTATVAKLTDAANRYTLNRTGMELLYLPLPVELRNRTKAFVDIFVDRMGRGLGGMLLVLLSALAISLRHVWLFAIGFAVFWGFLVWRARGEYLLSVRRRLEARRLDLEGARVAVGDPATVALLEQAARSGNPRQVCYALSLLAEVPNYTLEPLLAELASSPSAEVRGKVYELGTSVGFSGLLEPALQEIRSSFGAAAAVAVKPAVGYVLALSPNAIGLAREFLDHASPVVTESVLEAMGEQRETVRELATHEWLSRNAADPDPERRRLAAVAVGVCGDEGTEALHRLLEDPEPRVVAAACRAAGALRNRAYFQGLVTRLTDARLRGVAIESLAAYGTRISGTLGDLLEDESVSVGIRRHIPRVLKSVPDQRSVDVLLRCISQPNLTIRSAVLRALNGLRETAPGLDYGPTFVTKQILNEARYYFELNAALAPFRDQRNPRTAAGLLALSIEERLKQTLERLFRLLGLRYPPKEIYAAYLAVHHGRRDQFAAALEFLDNVLDRELKRILLPLLDDSGNLMERGRDLFGVEVRGTEEAIRDLIRSGDSWLVSCAMAAAGELKLRNLAPDISQAARGAGTEVCQMARAAQAALA